MSLVSHDISEGFLKSWGMILVSEIGDKTFFIAAIMAMRNSRSVVFGGAFAALAAMTVLSAALGWAAPNLISRKYTHWAAILLFLLFGLRALYDALSTSETEGESEWEEVERELGGSKPVKEDEDWKRGGVWKLNLRRYLHPVFVEAFILTFLAEWGDRSQIATIGLAAATDVVGVTLGGMLGHALCTGAAVLGGRHLSNLINEKTVTVLGGVLFLVFAAHALWTGD